MFGEFSGLAVPVVIMGLIMMSEGGAGAIMPLATTAFILYALFHGAKGFAKADQKHSERR